VRDVFQCRTSSLSEYSGPVFPSSQAFRRTLTNAAADGSKAKTDVTRNDHRFAAGWLASAGASKGRIWRSGMKATWHRIASIGGLPSSQPCWQSALMALACLVMVLALDSCSSPQSTGTPEASADTNLTHMSSDELAHFVFEHHGCKSCHTLGKDGKLGFTDRGKEVGKTFEGCISLLTAMNSIAQKKQEDWSADDKRKARRFEDFGCTTCHQVTQGKLSLTSTGARLASMHMGCTDVEKLLSRR